MKVLQWLKIIWLNIIRGILLINSDFFFQKCAVTGRKYTFKEIRTKSRNFGAALRKKLKLNKGDVVTVLFPNVPEFFITALGVTQGGLICTTVNPIYTPGK